MEEFTQTLERLRDDVLGAVPGFQDLVTILREESARQLHRTVEEVRVVVRLMRDRYRRSTAVVWT